MTRRRRKFSIGSFLLGWLTGKFGIGRAILGLLFLGWLLTHTWIGVLLLVVVVVVLVRRHGGLSWEPRGGGFRQRTAVYRYHSAEGVLLYVGITNDLERRHAQHEADPGKRFWWWRVAYKEVAWFDTREEAKAEETAWITGRRGPRPLFNRAENGALS